MYTGSTPFRKTRKPGGSNEYNNPPDNIAEAPGTGALAWEDFTGVEAPNTGNGVRMPRSCEHAGHPTRSVSGPKLSKINELDYEGT